MKSAGLCVYVSDKSPDWECFRQALSIIRGVIIQLKKGIVPPNANCLSMSFSYSVNGVYVEISFNNKYMLYVSS